MPLGATLAALAVFAVYVSTMFPSAAGGDATELAFIACDAAVPHPPGYPTFTMMASLSSRLFAWRRPFPIPIPISRTTHAHTHGTHNAPSRLHNSTTLSLTSLTTTVTITTATATADTDTDTDTDTATTSTTATTCMTIKTTVWYMNHV